MGGISKLDSHSEHHSCPGYPDSATSSIYVVAEEFFLPCLWYLIDILRLRFSDGRCTLRRRRQPPIHTHTQRSHWLIWPTPSTILMGSRWCLPLPPPSKIYVPARLAINHGTCSVGSELRQEAKSRPIHYRGFGSTGEPHPHDWLEEHQQDW